MERWLQPGKVIDSTECGRETGRVECVVTYKVDRLSRSLLDFARLMGTFEAHGVSFVSVTQQFNTATSVGRLMMNVLLSFAQFEREIIAERTRDKMSAARRRGKWTGGVPILGYDVAPEGGRLLVNIGEAERVRALFGLYLERRGLLPVVQELERLGWSNKRYRTRAGVERGGGQFTKTTVQKLLTNPLYIGQVRSNGSLHPGEHEALVGGPRGGRPRNCFAATGAAAYAAGAPGRRPSSRDSSIASPVAGP